MDAWQRDHQREPSINGGGVFKCYHQLTCRYNVLIVAVAVFKSTDKPRIILEYKRPMINNTVFSRKFMAFLFRFLNYTTSSFIVSERMKSITSYINYTEIYLMKFFDLMRDRMWGLKKWIWLWIFPIANAFSSMAFPSSSEHSWLKLITLHRLTIYQIH